MKKLIAVFLICCCCCSLLASCSQLKNCPDGVIDYIHAIKFNGISYTRNYESDMSNLVTGKKIGEVGYMLSGNACSNYHMKNGDATLLPKGTTIYEVVGYKPEYRLIANGELYEVSDNPNAKNIAELYDILGKIVKVSFESTGDGSHISDFTPSAAKEFSDEFLKLKYVGFDKMYNNSGNLSGDHVFLRVYLNDGSSFRISYWPDHNALTPGAYGTEALKKLILEQGKGLNE